MRLFPLVVACAGAGCVALAGCQQRTEQEVKIPSGTTITVALDEPLRTNLNQPGDDFIARTTEAVIVSGRIALPEGASIRGTVTEVEKPEDNGGKPRMVLAFEEVVDASGDDKSIDSEPIALVGGEEKGDGVINEIISAFKGPGEPIGGDGGIHGDSVVAIPTEDNQLDLDAGQKFAFQLESDLKVALAPPSSPR